VVVYGEESTRVVEAMFEDDFDHCTLIDPHTFADKPWRWHFGVALARLNSPIL
jgi:hypothetical protein